MGKTKTRLMWAIWGRQKEGLPSKFYESVDVLARNRTVCDSEMEKNEVR